MALLRSLIEQHGRRCVPQHGWRPSKTILTLAALLQGRMRRGRMNLLPWNMIIVGVTIFLTAVSVYHLLRLRWRDDMMLRVMMMVVVVQ